MTTEQWCGHHVTRSPERQRYNILALQTLVVQMGWRKKWGKEAIERAGQQMAALTAAQPARQLPCHALGRGLGHRCCYWCHCHCWMTIKNAEKARYVLYLSPSFFFPSLQNRMRHFEALLRVWKNQKQILPFSSEVGKNGNIHFQPPLISRYNQFTCALKA